MEKIEDTTLLSLFYECSHRLYASSKFHGQGRLLELLSKNGTMTQRELIDITGRRSATLSEQLENMDKAGYITRTRNEQDRRNVDVTLTPLGQEAAEEALKYRKLRAKAMFAPLSQEEKLLLAQMLRTLLPAWDDFISESEAKQK